MAAVSWRRDRKLLESHLVHMLDSCTDTAHIKEVHAYIYRKGVEQSSFVIAKLIRSLSRIGVPMYAYPHPLFLQLDRPNPFVWTALIRGYILQGSTTFYPFLLYSSMRAAGTTPVSFTFTALLKAATSFMDGRLGCQLHSQALSMGGFTSDLHVGNTLIDMYVKCGFVNHGRQIFDEMPVKDDISWTTMIVAYTKSGDMAAAAELFRSAPYPDMVSWTAIITGYAQNSMPVEALCYFERMRNLGVETDEVTLVGAISASAQLGAPRYADWVHRVAERSGFDPSQNIVVGSALVDMYSKCGQVHKAHRVFLSMAERNVVSYSSMILGFAVHGRGAEALSLFNEMVKGGEAIPNRVTFLGVLMACSHTGMVEEGRRVFCDMEVVYGFRPTVDHYACMVDLLGRAGYVEEALSLAESASEEGGAVWGALLAACRIHRNPGVAQVAAGHLFELEPERVGNYILLSNVLAAAGRRVEALGVRRLMKRTGMRKNPACSWVEGKERGEIHRFYAGDTSHPMYGEIKVALDELLDRVRGEGYGPVLSSVVYGVSEEVKRELLSGHSEKLALAFGLLTVEPENTVMVVKNVRICEDCHVVMCGASKITGRDITVRDNVRFHHFHAGKCSCRNFW